MSYLDQFKTERSEEEEKPEINHKFSDYIDDRYSIEDFDIITCGHCGRDFYFLGNNSSFLNNEEPARPMGMTQDSYSSYEGRKCSVQHNEVNLV